MNLKAMAQYQEQTIDNRIDKIQNDDDILDLIGKCAKDIKAKEYFQKNEKQIVDAAMTDLLKNQFIDIVNGSAKLVSNRQLARVIDGIWSKSQENSSIFLKNLETAFFRGRSGGATRLFTKLRAIKGHSTDITLGDLIVKSVQQDRPTGGFERDDKTRGVRFNYNNYYKTYIGRLSTSIAQIRSTLQGSVSNVKGALGEQQALSYVTALLKKLYGDKAAKGKITGDLHGELIDSTGTVQIKPDVLITYKSASKTAPSLFAISAKQYSSTSMGIAHQTVRSLLAMFTIKEEGQEKQENFYDYYLQSYSNSTRDIATVQIPSYTYLMIAMNALIGHMNFFSNTTTSALQQIDFKLQNNNTTSIPIPLVNAFFGFTSNAMYVVSTKQLLKDFYDAIKSNRKEEIDNPYKQILSIKPKTDIDAALSLATKGREAKYKNLAVSISLNAGRASQKNELSHIIQKFALS